MTEHDITGRYDPPTHHDPDPAPPDPEPPEVPEPTGDEDTGPGGQPLDAEAALDPDDDEP